MKVTVTYNVVRNIAINNAKSWIDCQANELEENCKNVENCYDELVEKILLANEFWFRQANSNPNGYKRFRLKKKHIKMICLCKDRTKFKVYINTNSHQANHTFYLRLKDYGRRWVVDKADFLPYLQMQF